MSREYVDRACTIAAPRALMLDCVDCGDMFVISISEQAWFTSHGLSTPKRCHDCRTRKAHRRSPHRVR